MEKEAVSHVLFKKIKRGIGLLKFELSYKMMKRGLDHCACKSIKMQLIKYQASYRMSKKGQREFTDSDDWKSLIMSRQPNYTPLSCAMKCGREERKFTCSSEVKLKRVCIECQS